MITKKREMLECDHGLYVVRWKSGGFSLASVGSLYDGTRWFAASNWTAKTSRQPQVATTIERYAFDIESMELILNKDMVDEENN